jgi:N-acetylglucosaminyltransferase
VIVPCYNEEPSLLAACLRSLRGQDYQGELAVWVVDDGSGNRRELLPVLAAEADPGWRVVLLEGNRGKREAQAALLREGRGELLVMIDSDTSIEPDGIRRIVAPFADPCVGAVTGDLRPSNPAESWLTRLIEVRYRLLFERERAAQAAFGAVLCCASPFSAYRRSVVERVWPRYIGQRFWAGRRVFGDDLKLTNLVLAAGHRSVYEPTARAATSVPATLRGFARQQLRWNRSFYRKLPHVVTSFSGVGPSTGSATRAAARPLRAPGCRRGYPRRSGHVLTVMPSSICVTRRVRIGCIDEVAATTRPACRIARIDRHLICASLGGATKFPPSRQLW